MRAIKKTLGFKVAPISKKVVYVPLKTLNYEEKDSLKEKLDKLSKKKTDAILVGISVGPSGFRDAKNMLTATDLIGKMLQAKARELEVPLVTYAEEMSLNNGMHLLMYGDHILANEVSMLGNIGGRTTPYYMKDFIQDWHVKAKFVHHGENKVRFNPLNQTIRQEDVDWFMNLQSVRMNFVIDNLLERRKEKVGENAESVRQYLLDGHHCYG